MQTIMSVEDFIDKLELSCNSYQATGVTSDDWVDDLPESDTWALLHATLLLAKRGLNK